MPQVKYSARIVADTEFIKWLIEKDKLRFLHLMHIKASSIDAKKSHNLIIEEDIREILKTEKIKEDTLRGAFKGVELPEYVSKTITNKIDQRIILAIAISTERPYKTYIFTTKENEKDYLNSTHYKGVKSISVKSEIDALAVIDTFWRDFKFLRDTCH